MRVNIGSREKLHHIEEEENPPRYDDPKFKEWQAADFTVFSWIIQTMESRLVTQFAQHQTAKALWKSLVTTFGVRADPMQVYDLETRTSRLVQGNQTFEEYGSELQNLWVNIESCKPCPYTCCEKGPIIYYRENEMKKLYQFLRGLDDRYDGLRRDLLKKTLEPTAESAFGITKQEEGRTYIWKRLQILTQQE